MKKFLLTLLMILFIQPTFAFSGLNGHNYDDFMVKKLLNSQVKYANKANVEKFISTYDKNYKNGDGFDLTTYEELCKDLWKSYTKLRYSIDVKNIEYKNDKAIVDVTETCNGEIDKHSQMPGELKSVSQSKYYLQKVNGKWKVYSDEVLEETTSMLYGEGKKLDIKLTAPQKIAPNTEYSAKVEFVPPKDTLAVVSINADKVVYPQEKTKEVYRAFPEDNELDRLFISNNENFNEYVIASIGLTKTTVCDLNIKFSIVGMAFAIKRVNVEQNSKEEGNQDFAK